MKFIKSLRFSALWPLFKLFIQKPLLIWPTLKATKRCVGISEENYGDGHNKNTPANAFRHALWNFMIANESYHWNNDKQRSASWAKTITDRHEDLSPNEELAKHMDHHNNRIGREVFLQQEITEHQAVEHFKKMARVSVKVHRVDELALHTEQFVHLIDL